MDNIGILTSKMGELDSSLATWTNVVYILTLLTAISGIFLYFAQYKSGKLSLELNKTKDAIAEINNKEYKLQISKSNEKAESERLERVKLEAEVAPRDLEQRQSIKELLQFKDINVIIESVAESEHGGWQEKSRGPWEMPNGISRLE